MKFFGLFILFFGLSASAEIQNWAIEKLPASLSCASAAEDTAVQSFTISALNTIDPVSDISDSSLVGFDADGSRVGVFFSNECDNGYDILFHSRDLWRLKEGEISSVTGLLKYTNADIPDEKTTTVTCTLN